MTVEQIKVTGMTCGHCAAAVSGELSKLAGVSNVDVDLETGIVRIETSVALDPTAVAAAVDEAGYELAR
jgi:copper chaperone CopZ